ncbi:MAG: hypothetical protein Tp178MES00d2C33159851_16 [Prokaryotic dsDNA virus sp.]|nr:MAG: hypothetical protein Tp178MES00d2C33159851_16 [Prokaryotic dsDNA virus sp.]|tara:strand:- start:87353 stop:87685 length:333 start_codon:yes stop_codon:yes gene_type:complete
MTKLAYGVEVWQYIGDNVFHWTERAFLTEQAARAYADAQEKEWVCPDTGEKLEQDWEVTFLVLEGADESADRSNATGALDLHTLKVMYDQVRNYEDKQWIGFLISKQEEG